MEYKLASTTWRDQGLLDGADSSGFAQVRLVESLEGRRAVAKLFPRSNRAYREILINEQAKLVNMKNVVPMLDSGEHRHGNEDSYVIVMPRAEKSLAQHLVEADGTLDTEAAIRILRSIAIALEDIDGKVIHRDIKPANILKFGEDWMLADFGIARAADEQTATETWKGHRTRRYAAPETIRGLTPTGATDIYSFGIMAYEILEGRHPYDGGDIVESHLVGVPLPMTVDSPHLRAMILSCLNKDPATRPKPLEISARLVKAQKGTVGSGAMALADLNAQMTYAQTLEQAKVAMEEAKEATAIAFHTKAAEELASIAQHLVALIGDSAPLAEFDYNAGSGQMHFIARLGRGSLGLSLPSRGSSWGGDFTVHAQASIGVVSKEKSAAGVKGARRALWYCDPIRPGDFHWYEVGFHFENQTPEINPTSLELSNLADFSVDFNLFNTSSMREIDFIDPSELANCWLDLFASAAKDMLPIPADLLSIPLPISYLSEAW